MITILFRASALEKMIAMTSEIIRAARMLLRWEQSELAAASGVGLSTIKRLETKTGPLGAHGPTMQAIRLALEGAGILFITADDVAGPGVRLSSPKAL